jgi:hypothetical protein
MAVRDDIAPAVDHGPVVADSDGLHEQSSGIEVVRAAPLADVGRVGPSTRRADR